MNVVTVVRRDPLTGMLPDLPTTLREADKVHGGLGKPRKMPGLAWGISPSRCRVGGKLRAVPGSTCSDCYACKGRYAFPNVTDAHERRLSLFGGEAWRAAVVATIAKSRTTHFRIFDAGDLQSARMLTEWAAVATMLPAVRFWMPTRELGIVRAWTRDHKEPSNLIIRASAPMIDGAPPAGFRWTSTVHDKGEPQGRRCTAPDRGGLCGPCRLCWDKRVRNVSYARH